MMRWTASLGTLFTEVPLLVSIAARMCTTHSRVMCTTHRRLDVYHLASVAGC